MKAHLEKWSRNSLSFMKPEGSLFSYFSTNIFIKSPA